MKIEIKCRFSGSVLFSHECDGNTMRMTVEAAVSARAYLDGANLDGANLDGAYLDGAYLRGAYLDGAYLRGAYLRDAYLDGAYLRGAYLDGAYLDGAYLDGANLDGAYLRGAYLDGDSKLIGERPIFQIGPIGSRCAYFVAYITDKGLKLRAGCFFGSKEEFVEALEETHDDNRHADEYNAALVLIDKHAEIWTPEN